MTAITLRPLLAGLASLAIVVFAACGDGADPVPTATPPASTFGNPPPLDGTVTGIAPEHASTVARSQTTGVTGQFGGICAAVDFTGAMTPQWFHMIIDGTDQVTPELTWFLSSVTEVPDTGRVCYQPEGGLAPGRHTATVLVIDPANLTGPARETVQWGFEVTP